MTCKKAILDRFEGVHAILCFEDGQTLRVHRDEIPSGAGEGAALALSILREEDREKNSQELAEALLYEIFNKNDTAA